MKIKPIGTINNGKYSNILSKGTKSFSLYVNTKIKENKITTNPLRLSNVRGILLKNVFNNKCIKKNKKIKIIVFNTCESFLIKKKGTIDKKIEYLSVKKL